jgi:hypothetical protein
MKIIKSDYSSNPWRLADREGLQVYEVGTIRHPVLGDIRGSNPICGATRRECEAAALDLLERLVKRLQDLQEEGR